MIFFKHIFYSVKHLNLKLTLLYIIYNICNHIDA